MNDICFIKNIDNLGRIVIPMDVRRKLGINTGDILSITCNDKEIFLSKYSHLKYNTKIKEILKLFVEVFGLKVILVNKQSVVFSNIIENGTIINGNLKLLVSSGKIFRNSEQEMMFGTNKVRGIYNMQPIVTKDGIDGSVIVFSDNVKDDSLFCDLIAKIIMLELNIS